MKRKFELITLILLCIAIMIESTYVMTRAVSSQSNTQNNSLPIYSVETDEKKVAITVDVNWADDDKLDKILEVLKENDIKATFFVIGGWINYEPDNVEKLKRIYESGNQIGNHSYIHPDYKKIDDNKMIEEIEKTNKAINDVVGVTPKYFRFPSGSYSSHAVDVVVKNGYIPIQWDVDSIDWKNISAQNEYDRVMKRVKNGSIILYHNNGKYSDKSMEMVIKELKKQGYTFVTIDELVKKDNYYIDNNVRQMSIN